MTVQQILLEGRVGADGMLDVHQRVSLPPGPVYVTVQAAARPGPERGTLQVLREIWAEREALGLRGRSKQEIDAEIEAMRDEDDRRLREIESIRGRRQDEE
jgi:hypothetical protein